MNCQRPECKETATNVWEGEVLCYGHAVDKREALLRDMQKRFMQQANEIWMAFYNSRDTEGDVDQPSKQA